MYADQSDGSHVQQDPVRYVVDRGDPARPRKWEWFASRLTRHKSGLGVSPVVDSDNFVAHGWVGAGEHSGLQRVGYLWTDSQQARLDRTIGDLRSQITDALQDHVNPRNVERGLVDKLADQVLTEMIQRSRQRAKKKA